MSIPRSGTFNRGFLSKMHKSVSVQSRRLSEFCDNDRPLLSAAPFSNSGRHTPPASKRLLTTSSLSLDMLDMDPVPPPLPMSSHPVLLRQQEAKNHASSHQSKAVGRPSPVPKRVSASTESLSSRLSRNPSDASTGSTLPAFNSHYDVPPSRKPRSHCEAALDSATDVDNFYQIPPPQPQIATRTNQRPADKPPPALPPKPRPRALKEPSSTESNLYNVPRPSPVPKSPTVKDSSTLEDFNIVSESMSLSKLIENHKREFPLQVRVSAGFFGATERETFSDGDLLNVHCMKQLKLVALETLKGRMVKVPLNSGLQFGVLFNPKHNASEAVKGFNFETAGDIIRHPKLPLLICATKRYKGSNADSSVEENEMLLVNEVKPGRFKQNLICTVIGSGKQKRLSETCAGHFTTDPSRLKMFLSEIINYFSMPQMAVVYYPENHVSEFDSDEKEGIPLVHAEVVRVVSIETEKTILATSALVDPLEDELGSRGLPSPAPVEPASPTMFEIPIELPVMEVQIVEPSESEFEKLYGETRELLENFDSSGAKHHVRIGAEDDIYYTVVRDHEDKTGIEFITSEAVYPKRTSVTSTDGGLPQVEAEKPRVQQPLVTQGPSVPPSQSPVASSSQLPQSQSAAVAASFTANLLPPVRKEPAMVRPSSQPLPSQPLPSQQNAPHEEIDEYIYTNLNSEGGEGSPLYIMVQKMHSMDESRQKHLQKLEKEVASLRSDLQQTQQLCSDLARQLSGMLYACVCMCVHNSVSLCIKHINIVFVFATM